jgi:hypothetical protein
MIKKHLSNNLKLKKILFNKIMRIYFIESKIIYIYDIYLFCILLDLYNDFNNLQLHFFSTSVLLLDVSSTVKIVK